MLALILPELQYIVMSLRKDFQPSVPAVTPEEMRFASDWIGQNLGQPSTPEVKEIFSRYEQVAKERGLYMRDDTKEIIAKMLPAKKPLDMSTIMDIVHVYYWWDDDAEEPANSVTHFLRDLDDRRFAEAVEVLHEEFRDLCAESQDLDEPVCTSNSGMACLQREISWRGEDGKANIMAKPFLRADAVANMLIGLDLCGYIFDEDMRDEDAAELLEQDDDWDDELPPKRPLHSLADMLSRHAIERLVEAGCDDIEAMGVTYVMENEAVLREQAGIAGEAYINLRNKGVSFEQFIAEVLPAEYLQNEYVLKIFTESQLGDEVSIDELSQNEKEAVVRRGIEEMMDSLEARESYYQLHEFGISPYYRRRFGEELFPAADRV